MPDRPNSLPANSAFVSVPGAVPPLPVEARSAQDGALEPGVGGLVATLDTNSTLAANSDTRVASQKATKTYVDAETTRAAAAEATKPTAALDTDGALAANSDTRVASQKATKTYVDAETTRATAAEATKPTAALDTDGALAANSDTRVASQKATKTYVDAHAGGITNAAIANTIPKSDGTNIVSSDNNCNLNPAGRAGFQVNGATINIGDWNGNGTGVLLSIFDNAATIIPNVPLGHRISTVAQLPAAANYRGAIQFVTDATLTAVTGLGLAVTGGGANFVPVYSDGTNWIIL